MCNKAARLDCVYTNHDENMADVNIDVENIEVLVLTFLNVDLLLRIIVNISITYHEN